MVDCGRRVLQQLLIPLQAVDGLLVIAGELLVLAEDRAAMAPHRLGPVAFERVVAGLGLQAGAVDAVGLLGVGDLLHRRGEFLAASSAP